MGRYAKQGEFHFAKIRHYYDHAGIAGHSQAEHHYAALSVLIARANRLKRDRDDVPLIQMLKERAEPLMEEMTKREAQSQTS